MASPDELWLVDFGIPFPGEPGFHRPALVIGPPQSFGPTFPFVILCPLTTSHRGLSLHVEIDASEDSGLDEVSYVQCELLRSVNGQRLVHRLGVINVASSREVTEILRTLLDH